MIAPKIFSEVRRSAGGPSGIPVLAVSQLAGLPLASSIMGAKIHEKLRYISG